jgi:hypothetical protein
LVLVDSVSIPVAVGFSAAAKEMAAPRPTADQDDRASRLFPFTSNFMLLP